MPEPVARPPETAEDRERRLDMEEKLRDQIANGQDIDERDDYDE